MELLNSHLYRILKTHETCLSLSSSITFIILSGLSIASANDRAVLSLWFLMLVSAFNYINSLAVSG